MSIEEKFTDLPAVSSAQLSDIICAVQGYVSPTVLGTSVQETLGQVIALANNNIILNVVGNPNTQVAGTQYQTLCWDSQDKTLWICVLSGTVSTAQWLPVNATGGSLIWLFPITTSVTISNSVGYFCNSASLLTMTLPTTAWVGSSFSVVNYNTGGFTIAQNSGQNLRIGNSITTTGVAGSVSSTDIGDAVTFVCAAADTSWVAFNGTQGNLTVV